MTPILRRWAGAALLLAAALLTGCAANPADPRDPLERFNRDVTAFNDDIDTLVLRPTATLYRDAVPGVVRTGVSNFFGNLADVWSVVNSLLQLKLDHAGDNMARVLVNSTMGLGGLIDVASELNVDRHKEDFSQTLGFWGVPAGPYLVLPVIGPSTLRDTAALQIDFRGNLIQTISEDQTRLSLQALRLVNIRANLLRATDVLDGAALDKYTFTRDAYLQRRRAEIQERRNETDDPDAGSDREPTSASAAPAR